MNGRGASGVVLAAAALLVPATAAFAQGDTRKPVPTVRAWAYVGPVAPLSGAKVKLRDANGKVVAQARTSTRGTYEFRLSGRRPKLPLTATTYGGRGAGKAFTGNMKARVFSLNPKTAPITHLSLISTATSRLAGSSRGYENAAKKVRKSLKIHSGALTDVLRIRNSDVGYSQLIRRYSHARGGFNSFARSVADAAKDSRYVGGLRPKSAASSGAVPPLRTVARAAQGTTPDTTNCSQDLPSQNTAEDVSLNAVSDVGAIGIGLLMGAIGAPDKAAEGVMGMLLAPIGRGDVVQAQDVTTIIDQLNCVDEQLNFLSGQIAAVQLSVDVAPATACSNAVGGTSAWSGYKFLLNNSAQYPINSSNTSLTQNYLPAWNQLNSTCGASVNNMLFGTSGQQGSAWQQLNKNTSAGIQWYTQEQVQDLQIFLSYWGTILYQQFVLTNEYDNYNGSFEASQAAAGGTVQSNGTDVQSDPPSLVCSAGSTASTSSYCVWLNNIINAFPGTLYSDEIGVIGNGQGVSAIPGGVIAGVVPEETAVNSQVGSNNIFALPSPPASAPINEPMAMNLQWWFNYYLGSAPNTGTPTGTVQYTMGGGQPSCPGRGAPLSGCPTWSTENFSQAAANWFNGLGVNPNRYASAIQTFNNPQKTNRSPVSSSVVSALSSDGPGSQSAESFFLDAINQTPDNGTPAWGAVGSSQPNYMASDSTMTVDFFDNYDGSVLNYFVNFGIDAPVGYTGNYNNVKWVSTGLNVPNQQTAFLTGRNWWPGSANATSYTPPAPPTAPPSS